MGKVIAMVGVGLLFLMGQAMAQTPPVVPISGYPHTSGLESDMLFLVAAPMGSVPNSPGTHTNFNIKAVELLPALWALVGTGPAASDTDQLKEGVTNLFFTAARGTGVTNAINKLASDLQAGTIIAGQAAGGWPTSWPESATIGLVADLASKLGTNANAATATVASYVTGTLSNNISGNAATATTAAGGWPTSWPESAITGLVADLASKLGTNGNAATATVASYVTGTLSNNISGNAATATTAAGGWPTSWAESAITGLVPDLASKLGTNGNAATATVASYVSGTLSNSITGNAATATTATTAGGGWPTSWAESAIIGLVPDLASKLGTNGNAAAATVASYVSGTLSNSITGNAATATTAGGGWPTSWEESAIIGLVPDLASKLGTNGNAPTATVASYVTGTLSNNISGNAATATTAAGGWPTTWAESAVNGLVGDLASKAGTNESRTVVLGSATVYHPTKALSFSGTNVLVDFTLANHFTLDLTTNAWLIPTNAGAIRDSTWYIKTYVDGVGGWTIGFGTNVPGERFLFSGGIAPAATTNVGACDTYTMTRGYDGTNMQVVLSPNFK
jgi:hypothetical protein